MQSGSTSTLLLSQDETGNVENSERAEATSSPQLLEDSEAELGQKRSAAAAAAWGGQPPAPPAAIDTVPQVSLANTLTGVASTIWLASHHLMSYLAGRQSSSFAAGSILGHAAPCHMQQDARLTHKWPSLQHIPASCNSQPFAIAG